MRVLHLEDDAMKYANIQRVLNRGGVTDIVWEKNVADGIETIEDAIMDHNPFDLIITDMHYPMKYGEKPVWDAGEHFIAKMQAKNIKTPIIVCSSINEKITNILGNVWYQEKRDWETEMLNLLKSV